MGLMRGKEVKIELPKGVYSLGVRFCVPLGKWQPGVQAEHKVVVGEDEHVVVEFTSRERLWNLLFDIDLMLCLLSFFITIPSPWGTVYDVVSNGFFLLWAIHVWTIRTRFFTFTTHQVNNLKTCGLCVNPQPQQSNVWGRGGLVEEFFGGGGAVGVGGHHNVDAFEWVGGFGA